MNIEKLKTLFPSTLEILANSSALTNGIININTKNTKINPFFIKNK
jgi:hypothetical protein